MKKKGKKQPASKKPTDGQDGRGVAHKAEETLTARTTAMKTADRAVTPAGEWTNKESAEKAFSACKSSQELLALPNYDGLVMRLFTANANAQLNCPNAGCGEKFSDHSQFLTHVKKCNKVAVRAVADKKSATDKSSPLKIEKFPSYNNYIGNRKSWAMLPSEEKLECLEKALSNADGGSVQCLNPDCPEKLKEPAEAIDHIAKCFLPKYFQYLKNPDVFRALEKKEQQKLLREAMGIIGVLPCINAETAGCEQRYKHFYGMTYHIERCCIREEDRPWKCYRCGFTATFVQSKDHLIKCHEKEAIQLMEQVRAIENRPLRSKNALQKGREANKKGAQVKEQLNDEDEQTNFPSAEDLDALTKKIRSRYFPVSVSRGRIPDGSSRVSISGGRKKYKFRSIDSSVGMPSPTELRQYEAAISAAAEFFENQRLLEPLCSAMKDISYNSDDWQLNLSKTENSYLRDITKKCSVPVKLPAYVPEEEDSANGPCSSTSKVQEAERLPLFSPRVLHYTVPSRDGSCVASSFGRENGSHGSASIVYCGGPISTISSCPRELKDGRECVAVTIFTDEEFLIRKGKRDSSKGHVQMWAFEKNEKSVSASLCFIFETEYGVVLASVWNPVLGQIERSDKDGADRNMVGMLALGTASDCVVPIYSIHWDIFESAKKSESPCLFTAKPSISLRGPAECGKAPIISLAWSHFDGGSTIAAVSASGHVLVWDLNNYTTPAKTLPEESPFYTPHYVAFSNKDELAVSYREKVLRVYDLTNFNTIIEEGAPRTGGAKIGSCEKLFPGFISYQGDSTTAGDFLLNSGCYITFGPSREGFFVVPLANKHEVQMWEIAVCPRTGSVFSVGGDGRLVVALNGRLAPHGADVDFPFNGCRIAMTLIRQTKKDSDSALNAKESVQEDTESNVGTSVPLPATDLETCARQQFLEISFEDSKHNKEPITQYSLDLRTESLNRVAASQISGGLAVCGGEAGLLIFLPCQL